MVKKNRSREVSHTKLNLTLNVRLDIRPKQKRNLTLKHLFSNSYAGNRALSADVALYTKLRPRVLRAVPFWYHSAGRNGFKR
jgi:hypothetical protein